MGLFYLNVRDVGSAQRGMRTKAEIYGLRWMQVCELVVIFVPSLLAPRYHLSSSPPQPRGLALTPPRVSSNLVVSKNLNLTSAVQQLLLILAINNILPLWSHALYTHVTRVVHPKPIGALEFLQPRISHLLRNFRLYSVPLPIRTGLLQYAADF